jgi:putative transposase
VNSSSKCNSTILKVEFSRSPIAETFSWTIIELNPVKIQQVQRPEDYPWSSCKANISGKGDELVNGHNWLDDNDRKKYKKFLKQLDFETEKKIRRATSTGRPLGSEGFIKKLGRKLARRLYTGKAGRPKKTEII